MLSQFQGFACGMPHARGQSMAGELLWVALCYEVVVGARWGTCWGKADADSMLNEEAPRHTTEFKNQSRTTTRMFEMLWWRDVYPTISPMHLLMCGANSSAKVCNSI